MMLLQQFQDPVMRRIFRSFSNTKKDKSQPSPFILTEMQKNLAKRQSTIASINTITGKKTTTQISKRNIRKGNNINKLNSELSKVSLGSFLKTSSSLSCSKAVIHPDEVSKQIFEKRRSYFRSKNRSNHDQNIQEADTQTKYFSISIFSVNSQTEADSTSTNHLLLPPQKNIRIRSFQKIPSFEQKSEAVPLIKPKQINIHLKKWSDDTDSQNLQPWSSQNQFQDIEVVPPEA